MENDFPVKHMKTERFANLKDTRIRIVLIFTWDMLRLRLDLFHNSQVHMFGKYLVRHLACSIHSSLEQIHI